MTLHHICALALYPGFIFSNIMGIGVILAWLHDLGDIFANICRLFNRIDWHYLTIITFLINMIIWFYTRLMILPAYIFAIFTEVRFPEPVTHFQPIIWIEAIFLMNMQLLHILWFGMFCKMGFDLVVKGERRDTISDIDSTQTDSKKAQ